MQSISIKTSSIVLALAITTTAAACLDDAQTADETTTEQSICAQEDGCIGAGPPSPAQPRVTQRSQTSLSVEYSVDESWSSFSLQRRVPGGLWGTATSIGLGTDTTRTFFDGNKSADARTCYRVRAANSVGTRYSSEVCGLTLPSQGMSNPALSRLQLRLKVANVSDAQTGDRIGVQLSRMSLPAANITGLNTAPRRFVNPTGWPAYTWVGDFARGRDFTYELELRNLANLRDISEITLSNYGSDAICVELLELVVNTQVVVTKDFGVSTCRWIERGVLTVPFEELRSTPAFTGFVSPSPSFSVSRDEIEARLEGMIGNAIWSRSDVDWGMIYGDRAVETWRLTDSRLHVDLDLEGIANNAPNAELDVDFDIALRFARNETNTGWDLVFDVQNFNTAIDLPWWTEVLGSVCSLSAFGASLPGNGENCATYIEQYIEQEIEKSFSVKSQRVPIASDRNLSDWGCTQPTVTVVADPTATTTPPRFDLFFACQ
jgi:hypothetical protein